MIGRSYEASSKLHLSFHRVDLADLEADGGVVGRNPKTASHALFGYGPQIACGAKEECAHTHFRKNVRISSIDTHGVDLPALLLDLLNTKYRELYNWKTPVRTQ